MSHLTTDTTKESNPNFDASPNGHTTGHGVPDFTRSAAELNGHSHTIAPDELAERWNLKPTHANGETEFHGPNPTGDGATKDGFILFSDGRAWDRKTDTRYTSWQVADLAGIDPNKYEPCAEFLAQQPNGHHAPTHTRRDPIHTNGATKKSAGSTPKSKKHFDTRSLIERGITPETMGRFQIVQKSSVRDGTYWEYPTYHTNGTPARARRKFKDPQRAGRKYVWLSDKARTMPSGYNLQNVIGAPEVWLLNGEVSVWLAAQEGIAAVCALQSESTDPTPILQALAEIGAQTVKVLFDSDATGEKGRQQARAAAQRAGIEIEIKTWPEGLPEGYDAANLWEDCQQRGQDFRAALEALPTYMPDDASDSTEAETAPTMAEIRRSVKEKAREISEPLSLPEVLRKFLKYLYLEDTGLIEVFLGSIAANLIDGDPVWLMIVGASGGGKTEPLNAASRLHCVHLAATVTESSLLSGTPKKDKAKSAKGGLLREIGTFGILLLKDFTSMLSQRRDASAAVLSAFRELYDGSWTRHVGSDGGQALHWQGKLAVIAGCTDTIDSHHAVIGTMGERFAFYRLPEVDERKLSRHALRISGKEQQMRNELSRAVAGLFAGVELPETIPDLPESDIERLIDLATLTARCRSAVERDNHTRDISLTLSPEAPTRIAKIFRQLLHGMESIGVERSRAWKILEKMAFDSMHKVRRAALEVLSDEQQHKTGQIATAIKYPTQTTRRALEELHAQGVLIRLKEGSGQSDIWQFSDWAKSTFRAVRGTVPVFQTDDISSSSLDDRGIGSERDKYVSAEKRERLESDEGEVF